MVVEKVVLENGSLSGLSVFVLDDHEDTYILFAEILRGAKAVVTVFDSAQDALDSLARLRPDVLISDLQMSRLDGFEFIRQVRSRGYDIPAVAISALARESDRQQALQAGFDLHVPKPVEVDDLIAAVASLTGRGSPVDR